LSALRREAHPKDRADPLTVSKVLTPLRFPNPDVLNLLGRQQAMIESPLLQKMRAETAHALILDVLKARFGTVPRDVTKHLREVIDEKKLRELNLLANQCPDLAAFRDALLS